MSQLIACKAKDGIILASDSLSLDFDISGNLIERQIDRLHQLSRNTAIMIGGASIGEQMCTALKDFISSEDIYDIDEVYNASLPFLASEYERFMRRSCEFWPPDPIHYVNFILAGFSEKDKENKFRLFLLWTKRKLPQLDGDEISAAFTVPRVIKIEHKLNGSIKENTEAVKILPEVRKQLEEQARNHEEIRAPFSYALITSEGFMKI